MCHLPQGEGGQKRHERFSLHFTSIGGLLLIARIQDGEASQAEIDMLTGSLKNDWPL